MILTGLGNNETVDWGTGAVEASIFSMFSLSTASF